MLNVLGIGLSFSNQNQRAVNVSVRFHSRKLRIRVGFHRGMECSLGDIDGEKISERRFQTLTPCLGQYCIAFYSWMACSWDHMTGRRFQALTPCVGQCLVATQPCRMRWRFPQNLARDLVANWLITAAHADHVLSLRMCPGLPWIDPRDPGVRDQPEVARDLSVCPGLSLGIIGTQNRDGHQTLPPGGLPFSIKFLGWFDTERCQMSEKI